MGRMCSLAFCLLILLSASHAAENSIERTSMHNEPLPQFLYKILSLRHWQATSNRKNVVLPGEDEAVVQLLAEDQLERVIAQLWSQAPELVVLKIQTDKLKGKWVHQAETFGQTLFYHRYEGFIPLDSIIESRIVYQKPLSCGRSFKRDLVQIGDPVLRHRARELSVEEILSPEIQSLIEDMKETMRAAPGVGLAAPQIGQSLQLIVIEDMDHTHLTAEQIAQRDRQKVPFHVLINPRLTIEDTQKALFFEGCLSVPHFVGLVPRALSVKVECLNQMAKPVIIRGKGWYARILQHEIDHLNATLYVDRVESHTLMTEENYVKLWKMKSAQEVVNSLNEKKN